MMSDVLAFSKEPLRTSDRSVQSAGYPDSGDVRHCLYHFVRGKKPDESMLEMARDRGLVVMATGHRMFSACGMLYQAGLHGGAI